MRTGKQGFKAERACQIFCVNSVLLQERNPPVSEQNGELVERHSPLQNIFRIYFCKWDYFRDFQANACGDGHPVPFRDGF
jgi:hypothetical protein